MEKHASLTLTLLSLSHAMNHVYQLTITVLLPLIKEEYGLTYFMTGVLGSVQLLPYSLLQVLFGYLSGRFSRKKIVISGFIITALAFLAMGFRTNIFIFSVLLFIAGIGGSTYHPNGVPLLSEFYKDKMGQASGFHQTGGSIGSLILPLLAAPLAYIFNWRVTLTILTIPGLILALVLWRFLPEPTLTIEDKKVTQGKEDRKTILKKIRPSIILILAAAIFVSGQRGIDSISTLYFTSMRSMNIVEAGFFFSMFKIAGLFSSPLTGRLSDSFGRTKVLILLIGVASSSLFSLPWVPDSALIVPCIVFGFASFGLLTITDAFLVDITPKDYASTLFGIHYTVSFLSSIIISPILGFITDSIGFNVGFTILSLILPLSIPLLLVV